MLHAQLDKVSYTALSDYWWLNEDKSNKKCALPVQKSKMIPDGTRKAADHPKE